MRTTSETHLSGNNVGRSVAYFLIGGSLGAAAALLFAPKTGKELRNDIATTARTSYDGAADLVDRVKDGSASIYNSIKDRSSKVLDLAGETALEAKDRVSAAVDAGKKVTNEIRTEAKEKYEEKVTAFRVAGDKRKNGKRRASGVI